MMPFTVYQVWGSTLNTYDQLLNTFSSENDAKKFCKWMEDCEYVNVRIYVVEMTLAMS